LTTRRDDFLDERRVECFRDDRLSDLRLLRRQPPPRRIRSCSAVSFLIIIWPPRSRFGSDDPVSIVRAANSTAAKSISRDMFFNGSGMRAIRRIFFVDAPPGKLGLDAFRRPG
jgi:hypothetical protein